MNIFITGGTGLIGRALCKALLAEGHHITVLSRQPESVAVVCGASVEAIATLDALQTAHKFDAVINLAGEPIADKFWSDRQKKQLWDSRIALTEKLVQYFSSMQHKPAVFLSGSAVGYYGDKGDTELDETSAQGEDFPAHLCAAWEKAALLASPLGVRVCLLRTGLVLSSNGGLLHRLLWPFKLGLGARLASGKQWMSWIHIDDYVAMVLKLLHDPTLSGAFNLTAPNPVTNATFTRQLADALHRPALFIAPTIFLKWGLGERSVLLLEGQRVVPARFQKIDYPFSYPTLISALSHLLQA
jgi:uncharacterized protein (TIGR01777 family)